MSDLQSHLLTFREKGNVCQCPNCLPLFWKGYHTCTRVIRPCKCQKMLIQQSCLVEKIKNTPQNVSKSAFPLYYKYQCSQCKAYIYFMENFQKSFQPWNQIQTFRKIIFSFVLFYCTLIFVVFLWTLLYFFQGKLTLKEQLIFSCLLNTNIILFLLILWQALRVTFKRMKQENEEIQLLKDTNHQNFKQNQSVLSLQTNK